VTPLDRPSQPGRAYLKSSATKGEPGDPGGRLDEVGCTQIGFNIEEREGVNTCRAGCSFWNVCYGGYASNKWAETGDFTTTATSHCRNGAQAVVRATADLADPRTGRGLVEALERLIPEGAGQA
jgi:hypothetical protein